jgi:hypothetical protein
MQRLVPSKFIQQFRKDQKQLVLDLSRSIVVGFDSTMVEQCPNCLYDLASASSGAIFSNFTGPAILFQGTPQQMTIYPRPFKQKCPVCRGAGKLTVPFEKTIPAHVTWESTDQETIVAMPVGSYEHHWVVLKSDSKYYQDFADADYFVVDGVKVVPIAVAFIRAIKVADGIVELTCSTSEVIRDINESTS